MNNHTARLVLNQEQLNLLLGLPATTRVVSTALGADGAVHLVVEGAGWPTAEDGAARTVVPAVEVVKDYGTYELRTIDWGFTTRQLS